MGKPTTRQAYLSRIKSQHGCRNCGERALCTLHFHHANPDEKDWDVSSIPLSEPLVLLAELLKCVVLCANCHRKAHAGLVAVRPEWLLTDREIVPVPSSAAKPWRHPRPWPKPERSSVWLPPVHATAPGLQS